MTLGIVLLIAIGIMFFVLTKKFIELQAGIMQKLDKIGYITSHPGELAAGIGANVASATIKGVKNILRRKKE
ncbi:MAG: hypothetical protein HY430_02015 [Candidatus Levybacteria bacterium]|nr:hypothetical protein [Candidatus Levybacteria bacterium]